MRSLFITLLLNSTLFSQEGTPEENAPQEKPVASPAFARKAFTWMQSDDPKKRQAAYRSFQLFGETSLPIYRSTLKKAIRFHEKKISTLFTDTNAPFPEIIQTLDSLQQERQRVYPLILTDYQKDPVKIRMLQNEVENIQTLYDTAVILTQKDSTNIEKKIMASAHALAEMHYQIKISDAEKIEKDFDPSTPESAHQALKETFDGDSFLKTRTLKDQFLARHQLLLKTQSDNDSRNWATSAQKEFSNYLNKHRILFDLTPLAMDEQLNFASTDHCKDMASIGFFAHQSPVEGKKTPNDRAKKAGFKHFWTGENIALGSAAPVPAYNAWFGSDGHRFIMFANRPDLLGIGFHGRHATMMSGKTR